MRSTSLSLPWRRPKSSMSMLNHSEMQELPRQIEDETTEETIDRDYQPFRYGNLHSSHGGGHGIKRMLRRASVSLKGIVHRRPSVSAGPTIYENGSSSNARPTTAHSAWGRFRNATTPRPLRPFYGLDLTQEPLHLSETPTTSHHSTSTGLGEGPPIVPPNTGAAAKASAALQNEYISRQSLQNRWLRGPSSEDGNDRESGIGITVTMPDGEEDVVEEEPMTLQDAGISTVDFVTALPMELAISILAYLDRCSLANVSRVSQSWKDVASNQHIWRESCLRETTATYATSGPLQPNTGLGLPQNLPSSDWKRIYRAKHELGQRWKAGKARPTYLNGHTDSIYCLQFDE